MPINKLKTTGRARAAIAAVMAVAVSIGGMFYATTDDDRRYPAAVILSADHLIKPWEGLVLKSHWDKFGKVWDICYGETKGIGPRMVKTPEECTEMLYRRVYADYYIPLTKCAANFTEAPESVQASMISGAYNFGVGSLKAKRGWCGSTAARKLREGSWAQACEAQTAWNKAGGQILRGLVNRREMGDAQRIGEAELCLSGLDMPAVTTPKVSPQPKPAAKSPEVAQDARGGSQGTVAGLAIFLALVGAVGGFIFIRRRKAGK